MHHATLLDEILQRHEISGATLARALNTAESTVSRWRNGITPSFASQQRIVRKLRKRGVTEEEIASLGWDEKEPANA